jgi:hypothetical protein
MFMRVRDRRSARHGVVAVAATVLLAAGLVSVAAAPAAARSEPVGLQAVSCASQDFCVTIDSLGRALTFNGSTWSQPRYVDAHHLVTDLSCTSTRFCMAVDEDGGVVVRHSNGRWSTRRVIDKSPDGLAVVSCASSAFCVAGDHEGWVFRYRGKRGWAHPVRVGNWERWGALLGVSCASSSLCRTIDYGMGTSRFTGTTWTRRHHLDSASVAGNLRHSGIGISCPTSRFCTVVEEGGWAVTYDASRTHGWSTPVRVNRHNPAGYGPQVAGVSCSSARFCLMFDGTGVVPLRGGAWQKRQELTAIHRQRADGSSDFINDLSCTSSNVCVLVDTFGGAMTFDGHTWSGRTQLVGRAGSAT